VGGMEVAGIVYKIAGFVLNKKVGGIKGC